jgi:hypothetical protein
VTGHHEQKPQQKPDKVEVEGVGWVDLGEDEVVLRYEAPESILNRMFSRNERDERDK